METFDKRGKSFEAKYAHDQETLFKIGARRNKLLGQWMAEQLGLTGADAEAYAIKIKAEADAEQTRVVAEAIKNDGQPAINFEIMKRQVDGISELASSNQTKTLVVPSDITKALGTIELFLDTIKKDNKSDG